MFKFQIYKKDIKGLNLIKLQIVVNWSNQAPISQQKADIVKVINK